MARAKGTAKTAEKKEIIEEIKKEETAATVKAEEETAQKTEKSFTQDDVDRLVNEAVQKALAAAQPQTVVKVAKDEYVTLLFAGVMANGCIVGLGKMGQINRNFGTLDVPKREFFQNIDYKIEKLLKTRRVVVVNGLTDEERDRFDLNYKDGELLSDRVYGKLLDLPLDDLKGVFEKLCPAHQQTVATVFITAYQSGDNRVTQSKAAALNKLSKKNYPEGLFSTILQDIGEKLAD